jgi:hypothetical protein
MTITLTLKRDSGPSDLKALVSIAGGERAVLHSLTADGQELSITLSKGVRVKITEEPSTGGPIEEPIEPQPAEDKPMVLEDGADVARKARK